MKLLAELKRRNVIRMAGLYLVGAWLVTQVAATLLPVFDAPTWVMKVLVGLLALGFLAAVVFSWIFELTPDGLKRDAEVTSTESIAPQTARRMDRVLLLVMAMALGYFALDKFVLTPARVAPPTQVATGATEAEGAAVPASTAEASIAVLPFVNMSTDVENGFFADGISEELLNVLAGIDGLKVASRTSSFSFRGKDTPIPEIARQLDVRHVLDGSVRKQGQRVRITAQLIHAGSDGQLWSETYDRDLTDIFKVQEEIAQAIAGELQGMLGERQVAVTASTANLDAYQSFLRGRARLNARTELLEAIDDLSSAVAQDPDFAEAWVYLSATWLVATGYHDEDEIKAAESKAQSRAALTKAEALAPEHPMVLAIQAQMLELEGDFSGALALMGRSAALSVQDSNPMMWHGLVLLRSGYIDEAIAVLESARKQDPLAGINNGYLALAYLSAGQNAKAEASARKALAQGWNPAMFVIVYDMAARGERERAVAIWDELLAPAVLEDNAERLAAIRQLLLDPTSSNDLAKLNVDDRTLVLELCIAINRFDYLLDLAEQVQKQDRDDRRRQWWLRSAWLPSTLALREDPRFFAIADDLGMVRLWETRGYPSGCERVSSPDGDRLECSVAD
jgi:TolB-like protein/tetratricopeptide (TPR) repeat protein